MSDASIWQAGTENVPVVNADGNIFEEVQVALAGQTVFVLTSFEYTPNTHSIFVWKSGVLLRRVVQYAETDDVTITLGTPCVGGETVQFISIAFNQLIAPVVFNGLPSGGTANQVLTKVGASDYEAEWSDASAVTTLLDAARVNVASASTINLAAIAATTRNIQITGNIQLDGFQVTNGQVWLAKLASSLTIKNNANIVTQSGQDIKASPNDTFIIRATADNVVEILVYSRASASIPNIVNDFRLSLTTGLPVTNADVAAAGTIYCVPYKGDRISLYSGTAWVMRESVEFNIVLAGLTVGRPYDVFCYDNAGTPTLELLAWASTTARATALVRQDGVLVKSGDTTRRYLGSFHALTAATTADTQRQRLLWNYYHRVKRSMLRIEATVNWAYNSAVIRQARADALNQLEYMCGIPEDDIEIAIEQNGTHSLVTNFVANYIGVDSTVASVAGASAIIGTTPVAGASVKASSKLVAYSLLGFHFYAWLENNISAAGVLTFSGGGQSSFTGSVFA